MKRYRNYALADRKFIITATDKGERCVENDTEAKISMPAAAFGTGTREDTAGVWSVTVDAVLNGRDAHTLR